MKRAQLEVSSDLEKWTDDAWDKGETDIVFVDTQGGTAGARADDLAAFSDVLIVPMQLGDTDLTITTDTLNWYCDLRERTDEPRCCGAAYHAEPKGFFALLSRI